MEVINLAHGTLFALGAYSGFVQAGVGFLFTAMLAAQGLPAGTGAPHVLAQGGSMNVEIWPLEMVGTT